MAITYEWSFPNFETDADNKVKNIHWRYTATETVGEDTHTASMYGSCAGSEGMDFDAMTKESATACVLEMSNTTEADMQSNLSAQIESQKAPELTSKTKDW
tara:strand:+ start:1798 stop:2100 length:303 start_codon:yes stop_codon:yes gene_type:complete